MGYALYVLSTVAIVWAPVVLWLAYGSVRPVANPHAPEWRQRAPRGLWLVLLAPLLIPLWSSVAQGRGERPIDPPGADAPAWPMAIHHGLAILMLVVAVVALYRYRNAWPYAVPTVFAVLAFTAVAWFLGLMAITNSWM